MPFAVVSCKCVNIMLQKEDGDEHDNVADDEGDVDGLPGLN